MSAARALVLRRGGALAELLAAAFLLGVVLLAVAAPLVAPGDPLDLVARPFLPPFTNPAFPLGTDQLGRDLWAALVHGAGVTVMTAGAAAAATLVTGSLVGLAAGFLGGLADDVLMRLAEAFQTVPSFLLALALTAVIGPSTSTVVLAIAVSAWPAAARLVRAEVHALKRRDFVDAARAIGLSPARIALGEILPNALAPVAALIGITVAGAILVESALSFLGLGDPNAVSWGGLIANGRATLRSAPHLVLIPGAAIALTVLSVTLVADRLAAWLDVAGRRP